MTRKLLAVGLVVSVVVNLVAIFTFGSYWREESRRRHGPPPGPVAGNPQQALDQLKERFQLTDVQMDTMRAIFGIRRATQRPVRDRLQEAQREILSLLQAPELDRARVDSLLGVIVAAQDSLETGALGTLLRVRNVLTREQRRKLPELFAEFTQAGQRPPMGPRSGPGEGPGPGHPPPGRPQDR